MRQNHIMSLFQSGYTTITCHFGDDSGARYIFKAPLSAELKPGDTVVVKIATVRNNPLSERLRFATVVDVHDEPRIDPDADFDYKWIVQKLNMDDYNATIKAEQEFLDKLRAIEQKTRREETLAKFRASLPENAQKELAQTVCEMASALTLK